jgi:hypothetical protein
LPGSVETLGKALLAALVLAAGGCDSAEEIGVELAVREGPIQPSGPLERCLVITATRAPLTLDRVAFEANDSTTTPVEREWLDLSVSRSTELCVDVCACDVGDEVGHFVVEDDGEDASEDVGWPEDYCCEAEVAPDAGSLDAGTSDGGT